MLTQLNPLVFSFTNALFDFSLLNTAIDVRVDSNLPLVHKLSISLGAHTVPTVALTASPSTTHTIATTGSFPYVSSLKSVFHLINALLLTSASTGAKNFRSRLGLDATDVELGIWP